MPQYAIPATRGLSIQTKDELCWRHEAARDHRSRRHYLTATIADGNPSDVTQAEMLMDKIMFQCFIHVGFSHVGRLPSSLPDVSPCSSFFKTARCEGWLCIRHPSPQICYPFENESLRFTKPVYLSAVATTLIANPLLLSFSSPKTVWRGKQFSEQITMGSYLMHTH